MTILEYLALGLPYFFKHNHYIYLKIVFKVFPSSSKKANLVGILYLYLAEW